MNEFKDRVAVITGAASGIGRSLAERCIREGMRVVIADVETEALARTEHELRATGATVLAVRTDVSKLDDVAELARRTMETFRAVHLLFNNAGVGAGTSIWESTQEDWEWVLGVNLWGVIHGLRIFVPIMLAQGTEAHVVNTASVGGVASFHPSAAYMASKHAVVALSEHLYHTLAHSGASINASVLCPGTVATRIMEAERNRPGPRSARTVQVPDPELLRAVEAGMSPGEVAEAVFDAIRARNFYIFTHPELMWTIRARMEGMLLACSDGSTLSQP